MQKNQKEEEQDEKEKSQPILKYISINWQQEKKYLKCQFFLTGFGKFGNHLVNPTSQLIDYINSSKNKFDSKQYVIQDSRVLEVTTSACLKYFDDIIQIMKQQNQENNIQPLNIVIHFGLIYFKIVKSFKGLYAGSGRFGLETLGQNFADFSIPDMANVQLKQEKICKDNSISHFIKTTLPIEDLTEKMSKYFPHYKVKQSQSAGAYICNYIYYISLFHSQIEKFHSLFVHVPEFKEINESVQQQFLEKLLDEIYLYFSGNIIDQTNQY